MTQLKTLLGFIVAVTVLSVSVPGTSAASTRPNDLNPFYGVVSQKNLDNAEYNQMEWGRIGFYRLPVSWGTIEGSGDGDYDWSRMDDAVRATAERGIKLMPTVYDSPSWLTYRRETLPVWSGYAISKWKSLLTAMVDRYGTGGDYWAENPDVPRRPVVDWQVWNEPNIKFFASPVSPSKYAKLLKVSARVIRAADSRAKVVLGGLYGSPKGNGIDPAPFLKRMYRINGFRQSFDIAAVHPYGATTRKSISKIFPVRGVLNRHGNKRRPMYVTEIGWGSDSSTQFGLGSAAAQASEVTSAYTSLLKYRSRLRLKAVVWFSWTDLPDTARTCTFCYKTGLFDDDGNAKPSWWALLDFTHGT